MDELSPILPPSVISSPLYILPFKKVPVVKITALALSFSPFSKQTPFITPPLFRKKLFTVHNNRLETLELVGDSPNLFLSRATGNISKVIEHLAEFLVKNGQILNASSLLYYGGLNVQRLKEEYELKTMTDSGYRVQFNISMEIIAEFEFSIQNYRRINIMYSLNPGA